MLLLSMVPPIWPALLMPCAKVLKGENIFQGLVESDIVAAVVEEPVAALLWTKRKVYVVPEISPALLMPRVHGEAFEGR
jgi:hypothetical protein